MDNADELDERQKAREQLRRAVEASGLSQAEFGLRKNIPHRTIQRWLAEGPPNPVLDWIRIVSPD